MSITAGLLDTQIKSILKSAERDDDKLMDFIEWIDSAITLVLDDDDSRFMLREFAAKKLHTALQGGFTNANNRPIMSHKGNLHLGTFAASYGAELVTKNHYDPKRLNEIGNEVCKLRKFGSSVAQERVRILTQKVSEVYAPILTLLDEESGKPGEKKWAKHVKPRKNRGSHKTGPKGVVARELAKKRKMESST